MNLETLQEKWKVDSEIKDGEYDIKFQCFSSKRLSFLGR